MVETDLGTATIVYEDPDDGTVEKTVDNEHIAYFQDHWIVKTGDNEGDRDTVRRIPHQRVYYVERSVEEFEEEVETLVDQVQSIASDLRTKIPVGSGGGEREGEAEDVRPIEIGIEEADGTDGDDDGQREG